MMNFRIITFLLLLTACSGQSDGRIETPNTVDTEDPAVNATSIVILGTIQDAGSPQIGCTKTCCKDQFEKGNDDRRVVSLGLFDAESGNKYLFEATPDLPKQMKALSNFAVPNDNELADGIFLTHAHIGHYTGLMYLGKEAMSSKRVPVFAMSRMKQFLESNGPWDQLVSNENIQLNEISDGTAIKLSENLEVTPFLVPHRDEYSETVGYLIKGPSKSALFVPDIDKWEKWEKFIIEEIKKVDYAFLDATFFSGEELNNRDMSEIPHPFVIESMKKFQNLSKTNKSKVVFIHFNHTNPIINLDSKEAKEVINQGFKIGIMNEVFQL